MDFNILDYGVLASGKEINTKIINLLYMPVQRQVTAE